MNIGKELFTAQGNLSENDYLHSNYYTPIMHAKTYVNDNN